MRPFFGLVTRTRVPSGSVRCAAVSACLSNRSPDAVGPPCCSLAVPGREAALARPDRGGRGAAVRRRRVLRLRRRRTSTRRSADPRRGHRSSQRARALTACTRRRASVPALSSAALRSECAGRPVAELLARASRRGPGRGCRAGRPRAGTCRSAPWCGTATRTDPRPARRSIANGFSIAALRDVDRARPVAGLALDVAQRCRCAPRFEPPGLSQPVTWQPMQSKSNCWPRSTSVFHALRVHGLLPERRPRRRGSREHALDADVASAWPLAAAGTGSMLAAALTLASPAARSYVADRGLDRRRCTPAPC